MEQAIAPRLFKTTEIPRRGNCGHPRRKHITIKGSGVWEVCLACGRPLVRVAKD